MSCLMWAACMLAVGFWERQLYVAECWWGGLQQTFDGYKFERVYKHTHQLTRPILMGLLPGEYRVRS